MAYRHQQLESSMQRAIGEVLAAGLNDPRVTGIISVTEVKVSPDRRHAVVKVSVMPETSQRRTVRGLRHAAGHVQSLVGRELHTRSVPQLDFRVDDSLKTQARMLRAIDEAIEEDEARGRPSEEAGRETPEAPEAAPDEQPHPPSQE